MSTRWGKKYKSKGFTALKTNIMLSGEPDQTPLQDNVEILKKSSVLCGGAVGDKFDIAVDINATFNNNGSVRSPAPWNNLN